MSEIFLAKLPKQLSLSEVQSSTEEHFGFSIKIFTSRLYEYNSISLFIILLFKPIQVDFTNIFQNENSLFVVQVTTNWRPTWF